MGAISRRLRRDGWLGFGGTATPVEAAVLRCIGIAWLLIVVIGTFATAPFPGLHGTGAVILAALIVLIASAVGIQPQRREMTPWKRGTAVAAMTAASATLVIAQPNGVWQSGPVMVAIVAAIHLNRRTGLVTLGGCLAVCVAIVLAQGHPGAMMSVLMNAIPWYLVMRMLRVFVGQRDALAASRAAEAHAAAAAERGRLAREMHDVLAHSLSALALQLESTRLLARSRGADDDVMRALDRAHHLAAGGLDEARRAIAAERGDTLPGPDRIGALADAFAEQSGLPVALEVRGSPRELAPEARLAVYRTAQEALTNVCRHATAERVDVSLDYLPDRTVLVVEDHAVAGAPPSSVLSLGSGYGLTGMRERAELLGGELLAAPTTGGFKVELRLPVGG